MSASKSFKSLALTTSQHYPSLRMFPSCSTAFRGLPHFLCLRRFLGERTDSKGGFASMGQNSRYQRAPESTDLEGWRKAINERSLPTFRLEAIVAAIQDL